MKLDTKKPGKTRLCHRSLCRVLGAVLLCVCFDMCSVDRCETIYIHTKHCALESCVSVHAERQIARGSGQSRAYKRRIATRAQCIITPGFGTKTHTHKHTFRTRPCGGTKRVAASKAIMPATHQAIVVRSVIRESQLRAPHRAHTKISLRTYV